MSNFKPTFKQSYFDAEKSGGEEGANKKSWTNTHLFKSILSLATDLKVNISLSSRTQRELSQALAQRTKQNHFFN